MVTDQTCNSIDPNRTCLPSRGANIPKGSSQNDYHQSKNAHKFIDLHC
ncbi:MAG: hypothetical protein ACI814_004395, partial [Mariniblastus sp.]